jgi:hypothetical protein
MLVLTTGHLTDLSWLTRPTGHYINASNVLMSPGIARVREKYILAGVENLRLI